MNARATRRPGSRGRRSSGRSMRSGPPSKGDWCPPRLAAILLFVFSPVIWLGFVVHYLT